MAALVHEFRGAWEYIYDEPPMGFIFMWVASALTAAITVCISVYTLNRHGDAAKRVGFTRGRLISLGIRADLVSFLLTMPVSYSVSAAIQVFNPTMTGVMSFVRMLHFSASLFKCVSLLNVLGGGFENLRAALPKEPIKAFAAPPLCCFFFWPCCKFRVTRDHVRILIFAMKQFAFLAPTLTLLDLLNTERRRPSADWRSIVLLVLMTGTSMPAMWGFNAMSGLIAPIVQGLHNEYSAVGIGKFVNAHMLVGKIVDMILRLVVKKDYVAARWTLPSHEWAAMISGLILCIVELLLALLAIRLFPWDERMYPTSCDRESGCLPLDTMALLQLNGIRTEEWAVFRNYGPGNTGMLNDGSITNESFNSSYTTTGEDQKVLSATGLYVTYGKPKSDDVEHEAPKEQSMPTEVQGGLPAEAS